MKFFSGKKKKPCKGHKVRLSELLNVSESPVAVENVDKVAGPPIHSAAIENCQCMRLS